jgi:hypothetical protein
MANIKTFESFDQYDQQYYLLVEKNVPKDKRLWNSCVAWAKRKYDVWPSAYACGAAAKRYKSKGGKWAVESNESIENFDEFNENLRKWFDEKWVDISKTNKDGTHPPCGRKDAHKGAYPKCRKFKVAAIMTDKEKANAVRRKRKAEKEGKKGSKRSPNYSK